MISDRPLSLSASSTGPHGRDPIQTICPYTGSNVTSVHPLRVVVGGTGGTKNASSFGVRCLVRIPSSYSIGAGDSSNDGALFVGHGGSSGATGGGGVVGMSKDEHIFLISGGGGSSSSGGDCSSDNNKAMRWKVRPPRALSRSSQSMSLSPDGRYLVAGCADGTCLLWDWTDITGDNLVCSWKAHYRSVTCVSFDTNDDGSTLYTAGEDGVVNAWCLLDLVDRDAATESINAVRPFRTWSEHHLPVTSLCILPGSGRGSTRLVSSSLDRNLVMMELGDGGGGTNGRTLARMCLPSGLRTVITDPNGGRLYCGGVDGTIYVVDLCEYAIRMSSESDGGGGGAGSFAYANAASGIVASSGVSTGYLSELRGHTKAINCLALLDPSSLESSLTSQGVSGVGGSMSILLASGSDDGTVRVWDLLARSCVKVLRPWSSSYLEAGSNVAATSSAPPVTSIIVVPTSNLILQGGNSIALSALSSSRNRRKNAADGDSSSIYKPLRGFVRGTSVIRHGDDVDNMRQSSSEGCANLVLWPRRDESFAAYWEAPMLNHSDIASSRKRIRSSLSLSRGEDNEINRLRKELAKSQAVIAELSSTGNKR